MISVGTEDRKGSGGGDYRCVISHPPTFVKFCFPKFLPLGLAEKELAEQTRGTLSKDSYGANNGKEEREQPGNLRDHVSGGVDSHAASLTH